METQEARAEYRRQWRKVHLGIDAHTLEIRAIEVTDNSVEDGAGGAPMLPELLAQISPDEALASVSADGAYDTKACHAAITQRGAQARGEQLMTASLQVDGHSLTHCPPKPTAGCIVGGDGRGVF